MWSLSLFNLVPEIMLFFLTECDQEIIDFYVHSLRFAVIKFSNELVIRRHEVQILAQTLSDLEHVTSCYFPSSIVHEREPPSDCF